MKDGVGGQLGSPPADWMCFHVVQWQRCVDDMILSAFSCFCVENVILLPHMCYFLIYVVETKPLLNTNFSVKKEKVS
jgi:hypothetical protein